MTTLFIGRTADAILAARAFGESGAACGGMAPAFLASLAEDLPTEGTPVSALARLAVWADEAAYTDEEERGGQGLVPLLYAGAGKLGGAGLPRPREAGGAEALIYGWGRTYALLFPPAQWGGEWVLALGARPGEGYGPVEDSLARRRTAAEAAGLALAPVPGAMPPAPPARGPGGPGRGSRLTLA